MRPRTTCLMLAAALLTAPVFAATAAQAAGLPAAGHDARVTVAGTGSSVGAGAVRGLPASSQVRVSVFTGRDPAGLAATATAVSDPGSPSYGHFLSPAAVNARYGATATRQAAVSGWLARSGLAVSYRDGFVVSATGPAARVESALGVTLERNQPRGEGEQLVASRPMTVPASVAGAVTTVEVAPATAPMDPREPVRQPGTAAPGRGPAVKIKEKCSSYYGQREASDLPAAYGRELTWAPCGYGPGQLRGAYGATRAGLTGAGASVAILSEDSDPTVLSDANRWSRAHGVAAFRKSQFSVSVATRVFSGLGDGEDALDVESVHGMAPAARVTYLAGNGDVTGDRLLDALDAAVTHRVADVVTTSWFVGYMPQKTSLISAWESVLERAAVEGMSVNVATGDYGDSTPLQYPGSDPWITTVGGTSLAVGAKDRYLWQTGWETDETGLNRAGTAWNDAPPGLFAEGSTGGISTVFPEPYYQDRVVTGNIVKGKPMRAVPDVSALGDWNLGYQIGQTVRVGRRKTKYFSSVNGGTSLSSPLMAGFEADLVQGRGDRTLGFLNPALYDRANTATFHDITGSPAAQGVTEAAAFGPAYGLAPTLSTMGQCASTNALVCVPGYDTVTGIGTPAPGFFSSFGSRPK